MPKEQENKENEIMILSMYPRRLMKQDEVRFVLGNISNDTFNKLRKEEKFPEPISVYDGMNTWDSVDVYAWMDVRKGRSKQFSNEDIEQQASSSVMRVKTAILKQARQRSRTPNNHYTTASS